MHSLKKSKVPFCILSREYVWFPTSDWAECFLFFEIGGNPRQAKVQKTKKRKTFSLTGAVAIKVKGGLTSVTHKTHKRLSKFSNFSPGSYQQQYSTLVVRFFFFENFPDKYRSCPIFLENDFCEIEVWNWGLDS